MSMVYAVLGIEQEYGILGQSADCEIESRVLMGNLPGNTRRDTKPSLIAKEGKVV